MTLAAMLGAFAIVKSTDYGLLSARTLGIGGASLALLAAFLVLESRLANPIMPLRILRLRLLMGSSVVRGLLVTGMFSAFFLGSLYLERVLSYDAIETGLAFLPLTVGIGALSMGPSARAMARFGPVRLLVGGLTLIITGLLTLAEQGAHASYFPGLFVAFLLLGLGAGASFLPLLTVGMSDAPRRDAGLASGIVNVSIQLFGAIGLATLGTIATDHTKALSAAGHSLPAALTGGYHLAYVVAAACVTVGVLATLLLLGPPTSAIRQPSEEAIEALSPQLSSLDLAARGLGQLGDEVDDARVLVGRGHALDVVLELAREPRRRAGAGGQHHDRAHHRAALLVRGGDRRRLGDGWMAEQRGLDLEGADAIAGRDDHVVVTALEVKPAVLVRAHEVARVPAPDSPPVLGRPAAAGLAAHLLAEVAEEEGRHARRVDRELVALDRKLDAG